MSNLPVSEMVLYKHGVGFFVRQGELEGTSATLTFRADEVNDILKSLAVFDRAGGQVYGVHYQTPIDKAHRLANTSIHLSDMNSATQLIQQIRGRNATLLIENAKGAEIPYTGRIIGIEQQAHDNGQRYFITMKLTDGMVRLFPFDSLRGINIQDEQSEQDLNYFLDTSLSEDNRRSVTVSLSEGEHDLIVYYVAPSPTWRVSYRLIAENDKDGTTGTALLQGWGLFDNRLEEDLKNVRVTLVAGQPISFIYDLYESTIPERPLIKDEARTVQKPVEYDSEPQYRGKQRKVVKQGLLGRISPAGRDEPESVTTGLSIDDQMASIQNQTATGHSGTTFQYTVDAPINVKRGESALVPIISQKIPYQRKLLYNQRKLKNHPVAAIRFENQTGLTLERGPVTVIEDNDYAGEAIIPFVGNNQNVHIPYAVDLSVLVKETSTSITEVLVLAIKDEFLMEQIHERHQVQYVIENKSEKDKVITIEASTRTGYDLVDTPSSDVDLLHYYRWHIDVPAHARVEFVKTERKIMWQKKTLKTMNLHHLSNYFDNQYLDDALLKELRQILNRVHKLKKLQREIEVLTVEKDDIWVKQEEFRRNMKALGTTGKEGTLRLRMVEQFEASHNRFEEIEAEIAELKSQIDTMENEIDSMFEALGEQYPVDDETS